MTQIQLAECLTYMDPAAVTPAFTEEPLLFLTGPQCYRWDCRAYFSSQMLVVVGPERLSGLVKGATEQ